MKAKNRKVDHEKAFLFLTTIYSFSCNLGNSFD